MKPQDVFGVILRSIAVWLCIWGSWNTIAGLKYLAATIAAAMSGTSSQHDAFSYFIYGVPALVAGAIILTFADSFVRFTYPPPKPPPLPPLPKAAAPDQNPPDVSNRSN